MSKVIFKNNFLTYQFLKKKQISQIFKYAKITANFAIQFYRQKSTRIAQCFATIKKKLNINSPKF